MTNREKFKEVFGFEPEAYKDEAVCNFVICGDQECKTCRYCNWSDAEYATWDDEYKEVKEVPSGKWVNHGVTWECSECHYEVQAWNNTPYCPNCGAKMEQKGENTDE